ncbi:MAG: AMP-binding protein, partial [Alistipes sp.]
MTTLFHQEIISKVLEVIQNFPNRNALCIEGKYYTYQEFGHYISKIRCRVSSECCHSIGNDGVGLVVNNDIETYASIFALWLEGKFYVPLHPNQPIDRCMDIVHQVAISSILDSSEQTRYTNIDVHNTHQLQYEKDCLTCDDKYADDRLAYILFTSGSTGQPKGVTL